MDHPACFGCLLVEIKKLCSFFFSRSTVEAFICFVIDCNNFFVHLADDNKINEIMEKMDDLYVKKVKGEPPQFNQQNKLEGLKYCASLYQGGWYRAQALTDPVPNRNFEVRDIQFVY